MIRRHHIAVSVLALSIGAASCGSAGPEPVDLKGAGATFPAPLYGRWFKDYSDAHSNVRVDYAPVGSGTGITQFTNKTVDFGASDAAMTDDEISKVAQGVQLIPMTAGIIVLAYNVPDVTTPLHLSRSAYAGIFLGKITSWDAPEIASANPGVKLPKLNISVVHRADSSGTSFAFTQHLSEISPEWKAGPGTSKSPNWPTGIGSNHNDGVTASVKQNPGSIGFIEYGYAKSTGLPLAWLENKAGKYVEPGTPSAQAALAGAPFPENLRLFIPDPDAPGAYPIVTYTWLLAYRNYTDPKTADALKDLVRYCLGPGQTISEELGYVPLPDSVASQSLKALDNIK